MGQKAQDFFALVAEMMLVRKALLLLLCHCCLAASSRLRRESLGKEAELDDVLKVAKHAHEAGNIYVKAKASLGEGSAGNDVYLVVGLRAL